MWILKSDKQYGIHYTMSVHVNPIYIIALHIFLKVHISVKGLFIKERVGAKEEWRNKIECGEIREKKK